MHCKLKANFKAAGQLDWRTRDGRGHRLLFGQCVLLHAEELRAYRAESFGCSAGSPESTACVSGAAGADALLHQWFRDLDDLCLENATTDSEVLAR